MANDNPYASPVSAGQMPLNQDKHGQKLATRWERFLGAFVDGLIVGSLNFVAGMYVVAPFFVGVGGFDVTFLVVSAVVGIAVFFAVNGYFLATNGQTIGKMAVGTQIVSESDGQILPFGTLALKRYIFFFLAYNIPILGGILSLVNALLIFRDSRKCLHDDVANTKVIKL